MPNKNDYLQRIAEQLKRLDASRVAVIQANDCEALHDFRVALRSLRTLLPVILQIDKKLDCAISQAWKALAKLSNPSRDAEVMIALLGSKISPTQLETLRSQYDCAIEQLKTTLQSPKLTDLIKITLQQCQRRIKKTSPHRLKQIIRSRQQLHTQTLLQAVDTPTLEQWHKRRIIIKQLRYLTELAADWLPPASEVLLPYLKTAQTSLGDLHDAFVLAQYLGSSKIQKSRWQTAERDWKLLIKKTNSMST